MTIEEIAEKFKAFEDKYNLPPIFQMSDGKTLSAFIITRKGESCFISYDSSDADILEAAKLIGDDNTADLEKEIRELKSFCVAPALRSAAPETLQ